MKIPYNVVHVSGNILFAARGGKIHSFNLDGTHLSTWMHPDVEKVAAAVKAVAVEAAEAEKPVGEDTEMIEAEGLDEPPAKRQKVETSTEGVKVDEKEETPETAAAGTNVAEKKKGRGGKKSKNRQNKDHSKKENFFSRVPDRPVITHMASTNDGRHLLVITGHDKNIWIFEHDGKGQLTQLSQRTMPKRPSSVAIAPDSTIICADKFGDVYSLPLIYDASASLSTPGTSAPGKPAFKPSANVTTVHSKRNLRALDMQQRQIELASRSKPDGPAKTESNFEHTLLLGHVSMLTSLVLTEVEGRRYILTGDRDEHIRVSRYVPQAHVIEGFCLGHKEFVSNLTVPTSREEILISAGGDEELLLWDWRAGKLLSKTSILSLAREILPEVTKVAVSGLYSLPLSTESGKHVYILAICEDIQAVFSWQLTEGNTLNHPAIIQLPGKPLDLELISSEGESPKLIAAIEPSDPTQAKSLNLYTLTMNDEKLAVDSATLIEDGELEVEELDISEKEVRSLLYNVESLRKQGMEQGEDAAGDAEAVETEEVEAAKVAAEAIQE